MQLLKVPQIAKIIGKTDKTIHNHRNSGKLTMEKDGDDEWAASVAEVQRAYRSVPNIADRIKNYFDDNAPVNQNERKEEAITRKPESSTLEEGYKALLAEKDAQIEKMQEVYDKSLAAVDTMTKLLEHKNDQTDSLTNAITQIIERDQRREERAAERRAEKRKAELAKKREEEAEKNKTIWQKIFG